MKQVLVAIHTILLLVFSVVSGTAGDFAERRIIGFSEDGTYFAFEQFGVQDGSGFPYADIFIINTETDSWAGGSPFRTRIEDEQATMQTARMQNGAKAQAALHNLGLGYPGRLLLSNPPTEMNTNPHQVKFRKYANFGPTLALNLNEFPLNTQSCEGLGVDIKGFSLSFSADEGDTSVLLHQDDAIPSSRNCPLTYKIGDVFVFDQQDGPSKMIVLINVLSHGFEGPDGRYIAIPATLN